jgi:NAD(P)-dependent dehydrogenase (short-subunit alcohol dehydrogenase family)
MDDHVRPVLPRMPSFRLDGRQALVTGAGRGIGSACAAALAQAGAHVTLLARTLADVSALAEELRAEDLLADAVALDVTDIAAVSAFIEERGGYDILVNNAGTNRPGPFADVTAESFDLVMGLNVRSAFFVAQAFARTLVRSGRPGSIVNMSSQMGHVGAANRTIYCTSKHALEGLTKAMAVELAPAGIRVNSICPTFIETPMTAPFFADPAFREATLGKIKLGRLGRVEDIMGAVVYLASDASALVTGSSIVVDGGWTAE